MNKNKNFLWLIALVFGLNTEGVYAQAAINTDGSPPSANTILDLNPAVGKAFIPPTMNWAQIKAISPAKAGMVVYDSEFNCLRMHNGTKWVRIGEQADLFAPPGSFTTQAAQSSPYYGPIYPNSVITDASGNVYITGFFGGTATFGTLPAITEAGGYDIFVAKYSSSGTAQWVQKAGRTNNEEGRSIAVDASGNVYITGVFQGTATFGTLPAITSAGGSTDIFVAKYNSSGTAQWVQKAGGTSYDEGASIAVDASSNVYITGYFEGTATFGSLPAIISPGGSTDIFVAKYNSSGTVQWVQKAGGENLDLGIGITVDASGNIYVTGFFEGVATFGTLPAIISSVNSHDIFVARLVPSDGLFAWVQKAGGTGGDRGTGITVDASGNVYVTGFFGGTATFGSLPTITSDGYNDIFVAKYNSSGTAQWVQKAGGASSDYVSSIAVDASGNVYITGTFSVPTTFGSLPAIISAGSNDIFVAKYNSRGTALWVQKAGGTNNDTGTGITVDASGNVYTVGQFEPSAQFANQILTSGTMFLMKYAE
jgi:hypothetical protein